MNDGCDNLRNNEEETSNDDACYYDTCYDGDLTNCNNTDYKVSNTDIDGYMDGNLHDDSNDHNGCYDSTVNYLAGKHGPDDNNDDNYYDSPSI